MRDILTILHYIIPRVLERNFIDENDEKKLINLVTKKHLS